jgi:hypothetical protein
MTSFIFVYILDIFLFSGKPISTCTYPTMEEKTDQECNWQNININFKKNINLRIHDKLNQSI